MEEAQKIHQIQEEMVERQQLAAEVEGPGGPLERHLHKQKAHLVDQEWLLLDYLATACVSVSPGTNTVSACVGPANDKVARFTVTGVLTIA